MNQESLTIELDRDVFEPGETITGRYRLAEPSQNSCVVKLSVFWRSEGKGDEDRAVEFEETRTIARGEVTDASSGEFSLVMPSSPLSYDGVLIKIIWFVQVRGRGDELEAQVPFQLGHVSAATEVKT